MRSHGHAVDLSWHNFLVCTSDIKHQASILLSWMEADEGESSRMQVCDYEPELNTRPNDGKCDREGNFVIGSYNNNHRQDEKNIAGMWRLSKDDKSLTEIMDYRFRCSNTIAFDQTGTKIYFCDTVSFAPKRR